MDPNFSVSLGLTLHLEHASLTNNQNISPLIFSLPKRQITGLLDGIVSQDNFLVFNTSSPISAHSIRKLLATYTRRYGYSKDNVDARGYCKFQQENTWYLHWLFDPFSRRKSSIHFMHWWSCEILSKRRIYNHKNRKFNFSISCSKKLYFLEDWL